MALARPSVLRQLRHLPSLPSWFRRRYAPTMGSWRVVEPRVPGPLASGPGIRRDTRVEDEAFARVPLQDLRVQHPWLAGYTLQHMWSVALGVSPRLQRASRRSQATSATRPAEAARAGPAVADLNAAVTSRAADLGISAIGIAAYDPRYTFLEHAAECATLGDRVIVCLLEQNHESTQTIPSTRAERGALSAYAKLMDLASDLAEYLHGLGYMAAAEPLGGRGIAIQYAVAAGLGQLGLNGQLLTPVAGSRCRISLIQTNAPLVCGEPKDFGVPRLCDACQVCVKRCPVGAIPGSRTMYRGVEKSKINTVRCWPVVAQAHGCAICMKVCPVQKYGLQPVLDEFGRTGEVLGKGTDALEGFDWIDGDHYGPGSRPKLRPAFTQPSDFPLVVERDHNQAP
jgi:ferredoxin